MGLLHKTSAFYLYLSGVLLLLEFNISQGYAETILKKNNARDSSAISASEISTSSQGLIYNLIPESSNLTVCYEDVKGCLPALNNTRPVRELRINIQTKVIQNASYFVITPTWKLPDEHKNIIGFHLSVERVEWKEDPLIFNWSDCQLFFPPQLLMNSIDVRNITFQCKDCFDLPLGKYIFKVWSLLKEVEIIKRNETSDNFVFMDIRQHCLACLKDPVNIAVVLQNNSCESEIAVTLHQFPSALQYFNILLHRLTVDNQINQTDICMPRGENSVRAVMQNLSMNQYTVLVFPEPKQMHDGKLCGCFCEYDSSGSSLCKKHRCDTASSCPYIDTHMPLMIIPVNPEKDCKVHSPPLPLTPLQKVAVVLATIISLIITVVIIHLYNHPPIVEDVDLKSKQDKKKVYIVYANGSVAHTDTVLRFQKFLEENLNCKVFIDQNAETRVGMTGNVATYTFNLIDDSDRIIIVDSDVVRKALNITVVPSKNDYLNNYSKSSIEVPECDNQFLTQILQSIRTKDFHDRKPGKIMIVRFRSKPLPAESDRVISLLGRTFILPQDIECFLFQCAGERQRRWPKRYRPKGISADTLDQRGKAGKMLSLAIRIENKPEHANERKLLILQEDDDDDEIRPPSSISSSVDDLAQVQDENLPFSVATCNSKPRPTRLQLQTTPGEMDEGNLLSVDSGNCSLDRNRQGTLSPVSDDACNEIHRARYSFKAPSPSPSPSLSNNNNNCSCCSSDSTLNLSYSGSEREKVRDLSSGFIGIECKILRSESLDRGWIGGKRYPEGNDDNNSQESIIPPSEVNSCSSMSDSEFYMNCQDLNNEWTM